MNAARSQKVERRPHVTDKSTNKEMESIEQTFLLHSRMKHSNMPYPNNSHFDSFQQTTLSSPRFKNLPSIHKANVKQNSSHSALQKYVKESPCLLSSDFTNYTSHPQIKTARSQIPHIPNAKFLQRTPTVRDSHNSLPPPRTS